MIWGIVPCVGFEDGCVTSRIVATDSAENPAGRRKFFRLFMGLAPIYPRNTSANIPVFLLEGSPWWSRDDVVDAVTPARNFCWAGPAPAGGAR